MNTALCFNDVLCYDNRPKPIVKRDGKYFLRLLEKGAKKVQLKFAEVLYDFYKIDGDEWEIELPFCTAINYIQIVVDGNENLEAILPITYGYSRPYNYIELPEYEEDFFALKNVPHGSVRREYFFSHMTEEWESCMVYVPFEYDSDPDKVYPVLYLQHGHGENEIGWSMAGKVNLIMDNLISEGKAQPCVIVMNNGMVQKKEGDEHIVDHLLFEPMLMEDVIPFIEGRYHVGGCKARRGIAGLSMGSVQASMIACNYGDMFSEVGIFSGFLHDWISASPLDMSCHKESDNAHLDAMNDADEFNSRFNTFFRAIGNEDPFLEHFENDDSLCREKGINCTRKIYEGTHDWNVWRKCIYDFAQMIFAS